MLTAYAAMLEKKICAELKSNSSLTNNVDADWDPLVLQQEHHLYYRSIQCASTPYGTKGLTGLDGQQASGKKLQLGEAEGKPSSSRLVQV